MIAGSTKWLAKLPYGDGSITKINNITMGCAPEDCEDFHKYRNCDILLHHYPPSGSKAATDEYGNNFGNYFLKRSLNTLNCTYLLCGHIHQPIARKVRRTQNSDRFIYNAGGKHKPDKVQHLIIEI